MRWPTRISMHATAASLFAVSASTQAAGGRLVLALLMLLIAFMQVVLIVECTESAA